MQIDYSIFKAYDIRGFVDSQLSDDFAYHLGKAFITYTKAKKVIVGQDMRETSYTYKEALFAGMTEMGANVVDIGLCSTPMVNYASGSLALPGIMITASHNPSEYNGFKLMKASAVPMSKDHGILDIAHIMEQESYVPVKTKMGEIIIDEGMKEEYVQKIASFAKSANKRLKIVVDCANGMGALEVEVLQKIQNLDISLLYEELDGSFPNHEANPLKVETLKALQEKVISEKADFGIAFDGDADRVGFVDEQGHIIDPSLVAALIIREMLTEQGPKTCLYDLRSSNIVRDTIAKFGGVGKETRVGHSFIKQMMREVKAVFACELSGHYYFKENYNTESSSLAVIFFLNALWHTEQSLSELIAPFHTYVHSGEINSEVSDKEAILQKLKEKYANGQVSELDGIKVIYDDWWFNVRASNTEDVIRLVVEAKTQELVQEKREELLTIINS